QAMRPKLFAQRTFDESPEIVEAVKRMSLAAPAQGVAAALRGMAERPDMSSFLSQIDVPSLVIVGTEDAISPPAEMKEIAEAIPDCGYTEICGAGHMAPMEAHVLVNAA